MSWGQGTPVGGEALVGPGALWGYVQQLIVRLGSRQLVVFSLAWDGPEPDLTIS